MSRKTKSPEIERLLAVMAALEETPDTLGERVSVSPRTINNTIWGDLPLGGNLLRGLLEKCDVSLDWLLTGEGDMFRDEPIYTQPKRLIKPASSALNLAHVSDRWRHMAFVVERMMTDADAVAGRDYDLLDVFRLAQPFVLADYQAGDLSAWALNAEKVADKDEK